MAVVVAENMDGTLLMPNAPSRGRKPLATAILNAAVAPLCCGFALGITYGNIGGVIGAMRTCKCNDHVNVHVTIM